MCGCILFPTFTAVTLVARPLAFAAVMLKPRLPCNWTTSVFVGTEPPVATFHHLSLTCDASLRLFQPILVLDCFCFFFSVGSFEKLVRVSPSLPLSPASHLLTSRLNRGNQLEYHLPTAATHDSDTETPQGKKRDTPTAQPKRTF